VRVAYLVTSYRQPRQLLRLLGTLRRAQPDSPFFVHQDRFRTQWPVELATDLGGVHVYTSDAPVTWGDFRIVEVSWRGLACMLDQVPFDWVVFLSEQDYPIAPLKDLEQRLATSGADAFVEATRIDVIEDPDLRMECDRRYNYRYVELPRFGVMARLSPRIRTLVADNANYANFVLYKLQKKMTVYRYPDQLPLRVGIRPRRSPLSSFPCWYGTQWIALSRRAAEAVVQFVRGHEDYVRHFARTAQPIEAATATIVCNDPTIRVRNEKLHWVRFSSGSGHPDVLRLEMLDELVGSGKFFARKFDIDTDSAVLDALDQHLFGG
jgi:hypothetical protein